MAQECTGGRRVTILIQAVRMGLTEKEISEPVLGGEDLAIHQGKNIPGRGRERCKDPMGCQGVRMSKHQQGDWVSWREVKQEARAKKRNTQNSDI